MKRKLLPKTGVFRRPGAWALLGTLATIEFARGALFIAILPAFLHQRRGFEPTAVGLVISAQYLADITFKAFAGALTDRYGPWPVLLPALGLAALSAALMPLGQSPVGFAALAFAFGIGTAPDWPAVVAGMTRLGGEGGEGGALSLVFIAWLAGGGLGPVLASFLAQKGYALVFHLVDAVAALAPLAALVAFVGRFEPRPAAPATARPRLGASDVRRQLGRTKLLLPGLYLPALALGMLLPVAVPFVHSVLGLPHAAFGWTLVEGGAAAMATLPLFGAITDRVGYRWPLIAGLGSAGAATLWLAAARPPGTGLALRAVALGVAYAAILPAWTKQLISAVPDEVRGTFTGLFMAVEGLGVGTGPLVGGLLWSRVGPRAPFEAAAALVLLMAVYYLVIPPAALRGKDAERMSQTKARESPADF